MTGGEQLRAWRLHLFGTVAVTGCLAAGYVELGRALAGNGLSWVYAGEWPLFAVLGLYVWVKLTRELHAAAHPVPGRAAGPARRTRSEPDDGPVDPQLVAWRAYVADLQAHDPPGGPPW